MEEQQKSKSGNPAQPLIDLKPTKEFFIGVDSDGCVFDSMEIKQKECFTPNSIKHFGLQAVSKYAREALEFVNLYSKWRGSNRFPALIRGLELLARRPEVRARGFSVPRLSALSEWLAHEPAPGNPSLEAAAHATDGEKGDQLRRVLDWSKAVNRAIADMVQGIPPFPYVREFLEQASGRADMIVVSATPGEALAREWVEHDLARYMAAIAGQEMGKKADHMRLAAAGKYPPEKILMIGDAQGDMDAARANHALFYPIMPGDEDRSWKRLCYEALDVFFSGKYQGAYENRLVEEFVAALPATPPWPLVE